MSKPAIEARLAAAAKGFTQVIKRGDNHIVTRDPTTGKCAYDGQVGGGWHYGAGLETDTAFEQDVDQNYLKMVKALYHVRARKSFSAGDLLKWTDPTTGQYVIFQPNNLSWVDNVTESQQFIASPAAVTGAATDDVILWNAAYGAGRHFRYQAGPLRLTKHLIIDAAANLPTVTVSNPYLELAFVMTPSSGVSLIVDGGTWGKKTTKTTVSAIEFRTSQGVTLWSFSAPTAHDSAGSDVAGIMQLRKQGGNLIVSVRFPKSWIEAATFPIFIDPTLDYQTGASGDDGFVRENDSTFYGTTTNLNLGRTSSNIHHMFARFVAVTIPDGATIDQATISLKLYAAGGTPETKIYAENSANPNAPTTYSDFAGRTLTSAYVSWSPGYNDDAFHVSGNLSSIFSELMTARSYASGAAVIVFVKNSKSVAEIHYATARSYDYGAASGPKLHIEYTEASAAKSQVIWI